MNDVKKLFSYERRVDAGIKWFNKNKLGWVKKIVLSKLDLQDSEVCVLGQLFKDFWDKVYDEEFEKGKLSDEQAVRLGFNEAYGSDDFDLLTLLWTLKIKQLKAKAR